MPLDPRAQAILDEIKAHGVPPFEDMTVPQAREVALAFKGHAV
jgi:acetyl esterase